MKRFLKSRRGLTLLELTIVLAVIVIVSSLVISFTLLINADRHKSSMRINAMNEIDLFESLAESFINNNPDCAVANESDAKLASGENSFTFENNKLTITNESANESDISFDRIVSVSFEADGEGCDRLYICKVTYSVASGNEVYIFCVNPYIGEGVRG